QTVNMPMEYFPHKWLLVRIDGPEPLYKVFASFIAGGDSWKINSGITCIEDKGDHLRIYGHSGSVYACRKDAYGASQYGFVVLGELENMSYKLTRINTLE